MREVTEIRAPADGTVLEVADRSIGSVLKEAETLMLSCVALVMAPISM